jgi:hypothetical protein
MAPASLAHSSHLQCKFAQPRSVLPGYQVPDAEQRCHYISNATKLCCIVVATINDPIVAAENAITLNNLIKTAK